MHRTIAILFLLLTSVFIVPRLGAQEDAAARRAPQWWKGNIHTHTFWSDGNNFPEMIADWYRQQDYNFLALSDHNVLSQGQRWMKMADIERRGGKAAFDKYKERFGPDWVEVRPIGETDQLEVRLKPLNEFRALVEQNDKFIMIQGEEISDRSEGLPVHLNATNLLEMIRPVGGATVREALANNLRAVQQQADKTGREILLHVNHPNFGMAVTAEDLASVLEERFFEVYNGHPSVGHLGDANHPSIERMWDIVNTLRMGQFQALPMFGVATDDSHNYHGKGGSRPGRGWVMVRATYLTPEHLLRAMKAGDFYCSSGVTLDDVSFDQDGDRKTLKLAIHAEDGVSYKTEFIGTPRSFDATSKPRVDAAGKPIRSTRKYSDDVGKVLATSDSLTPEYQLTGDEIYVRAVVTSTRKHRDPSFANQLEQAWTQPVAMPEAKTK